MVTLDNIFVKNEPKIKTTALPPKPVREESGEKTSTRKKSSSSKKRSESKQES